MYNSKDPDLNELPTSVQLIRSTLLALAAAIVLLLTVVLPAEYGIDPTGVGDALGLKRMGEIKNQLAEETFVEKPDNASSPVATLTPVSDPSVANTDEWREQSEVRIAPDEAIELKLVMSEGDRVEFEWVAEGGVLNFNLHADGGGQSIEYAKGRAVATDSGELVAAFDGYHGWFWRNRMEDSVLLTLRTRGQYSEIKRTR